MSPVVDGILRGLFRQASAIRAKWTANLAAEHTFMLPTTPGSWPTLALHYQSETLTGLDFTPLEYQDTYVTLNASLTYTTATTGTT